ncbi:MAG: AAA family ATPase [Pseudomonadota bacterium]
MGKIQDALDKLRPEAPEPLSGKSPLVSASTLETAVDRNGISAAGFVQLDEDLLREKGLLPEAATAAELSQQYRRVKRPLLRQVFTTYPVSVNETGRVLLVASALRGEGKTFTSMNIAQAIAIEPELQVLLIDGDAPKQGLTSAFGLDGKPGLLDLVEDRSMATSSVVYKTSQEGLFFMPAGARRNNSPELLGSSRAQRIVSELARRSGPCVVIIDSPPVLLANEARALSSAADNTLFIVRAGSTSAGQVDAALESIGSTENVYVLLNQSPSAGASDYKYGYGYGYGVTADDSATRGG